MKTITIFLCFLAIAGNIFAQETTSVTDQIKTYLQQYEAAGYHGSVLAASKGKILVEHGYGLADREAGRKQDAETVFCIGSITKQFTAAGIIKLESMGKIRVEDALSTYFPDAPADKAKITIHQLLTHTAGFPGAIGDDYETVNTQQFLKLAWETPLLAPPGTQYEYSNVGYSMLGILIEKISGKSYDAFLREHLWLPSGMKQTGYLLPGFKKENLAVGYDQDKRWGTALDHAWLVDGPGWHLRANGGVLSTVGDMYRWYLALKKHEVMPESAVKKLFTPYVKEGPNAPSYYGYGWVVQQVGEKQVIWHNGGNGVFNAFMGFDLENDMCIVASSNTMKVITDDISIGITAIIDGKPAPPVEVRSADFDPMFENGVSKTAYNILLEKGAAYFKANAETILKDAGFDFQDDMQLLSVGKHLEDAEKWEEGVALFETYTKLFPNIVIAWNRLGICRKNLGDKAGAKAAWEQSLKLRPNGNPAAEWLKE